MKPGRPTATIDIDGQALTAPEAALVRLRVDLSLGRHDAAALVFWRGSRFSGATPDSEITISLGTDGSDALVFTGKTDRARITESMVVVEALGATAALDRERRSQTYVQQKAVDIVRDLASSISVDSADADLELFAYAVDARHTAWRHVNDLGRLSGSDVASSPEGALRFAPPRSGAADHTLRFGATLLGWEFDQRVEPPVPDLVPHGAASEAGREKWHWLLNDPSGEGNSARLIGGFHSRDAADAMKKSLEARAKRLTVQGTFTAVGEPGMRPGDLVTLADLPAGDPGLLRLLSVRHTLDGRHGFLTHGVAESAGGSALS